MPLLFHCYSSSFASCASFCPLYAASINWSTTANLSSICVTSAFEASNMIRCLWPPVAGCKTSVALYWLTLGLCRLAVTRLISQSMSARPSILFAVGYLTACTMWARSCFQNRLIAFLVSSLPDTLRFTYFSNYSFSKFKEMISSSRRCVLSQI